MLREDGLDEVVCGAAGPLAVSSGWLIYVVDSSLLLFFFLPKLNKYLLTSSYSLIGYFLGWSWLPLGRCSATLGDCFSYLWGWFESSTASLIHRWTRFWHMLHTMGGKPNLQVADRQAMTNATIPRSSRKTRTLDIVPNMGEMVKPAELIDLIGAGGLTLAARRLYNLLIANAFGPDMGQEGREFEIGLAELRGTHTGNDRIEESIEALMRTIVIVRMPDGKTRRVQLLGGNDMDAPGRRPGRLCYSFDARLVPILRESSIFGILELRVMAAFSTKYALALYEAISRRVRMERVSETFDLEAMRELLGVPLGKLGKIGNLRSKAIDPAAREINALAPFSVRVDYVKQGKTVVGFQVWWWRKSAEDYRAAMAELERPRTGRRARILGETEVVPESLLLETQGFGSP